MQGDPIFTSWPAQASVLFKIQTLRVEHRLHMMPLFSEDGLAELISSYPREYYSLIHMGAKGAEKKFWREGEIGSLDGRQVIEAIRNGRMWLNLRDVTEVDDRYRAVLDEVFAELSERVDGLVAPVRSAGL